MPATDANGIRINYEIHGNDGAWVILVMGWGYGLWGWEPVVGPLAEAFRVVVFDNRGVGGTDKPPGPYTAEMMAADATGLADALGIERAHFVGTSGGGFYAMEAAVARPDLIDRLVIACSPLPGPAEEWFHPQSVEALARVAGLEGEERFRVLIENALSPSFVADHPEIVERILGYRLQTDMPFEAWEAQRVANLTYQDPSRVALVAQETLVTCGTNDGVVRAESAKRLAEALPNALFVPFEGAGHLHFWEQPERFATVLGAFLGGGLEAVGRLAEASA
ncbi:MAG: alpha/beta fold hydrolase [Actinomycetota bacterium]